MRARRALELVHTAAQSQISVGCWPEEKINFSPRSLKITNSTELRFKCFPEAWEAGKTDGVAGEMRQEMKLWPHVRA